MLAPRLLWDGSNLGEINDRIKSYTIEYGQTILYLISGDDIEKVSAHRFEGSILLVADELKPLFGLSKVGRHRCLIQGRPAMISRILGIEFAFESFMGLETSTLRPLLQQSYVFRWALGLTYNIDASFMIRCHNQTVDLISWREIKVNYLDIKTAYSNSSILPTTVIKRWFGDREQVDIIMSSLFKDINPGSLRLALDAIIRRIDANLCSWSLAIVLRIQQRTWT